MKGSERGYVVVRIAIWVANEHQGRPGKVRGGQVAEEGANLHERGPVPEGRFCLSSQFYTFLMLLAQALAMAPLTLPHPL